MGSKNVKAVVVRGRRKPSPAANPAPSPHRAAARPNGPSPITEAIRTSPDARFGPSPAEIGYPQGLNRLGWEHKADLVRKMQDFTCILNSLVVCQFSYTSMGVRLGTNLDLLNAVTGWEMDYAEFMRTGERIFNLRRLINWRKGYRAMDDTLPPRLLEKLTDIGDDEQRVPENLPGLLQEYYAGRGWDSDGAPTAAKLTELMLP